MDNADRPVTRKDLAEGLGELEQRLTDRFLEAIHDTETKLLKAFYTFAESTHKSQADLARADFGFRERLDAFESRLLEVEKRLNMPPAN